MSQWQIRERTRINNLCRLSPAKKTYYDQVYLGCRTFIAQQPTMLRVGYRYISQRYKTRDFTGNTFNYDVRQAGPVLGLTVRF